MSLNCLLRCRRCYISRVCLGRFSTTVINKAIDPLESKFVAKIFKKNQRKLENMDEFSLFPLEIPTHYLRKHRGPRKRRPLLSANNPSLELSERRFHENVSNIMQSGHMDMRVAITKVKLSRDFSQLNVYWEATGDSKEDKKTQNKLNLKTNILRHFLLQGQESGEIVPNILFIKDLSYVREAEFEAKFKNLDTGRSTDENENTDDVEDIKSEEDTSNTDNDMKKLYSQSVFGLKHNVLMKKVITSKLKNKIAGKVQPQHDDNTISMVQNEDEMKSNQSDGDVYQDEESVSVLYDGKIQGSEAKGLDKAARRHQIKQYSRLFGVNSSRKDSDSDDFDT